MRSRVGLSSAKRKEELCRAGDRLVVVRRREEPLQCADWAGTGQQTDAVCTGEPDEGGGRHVHRLVCEVTLDVTEDAKSLQGQAPLGCEVAPAVSWQIHSHVLANLFALDFVSFSVESHISATSYGFVRLYPRELHATSSRASTATTGASLGRAAPVPLGSPSASARVSTSLRRFSAGAPFHVHSRPTRLARRS